MDMPPTLTLVWQQVLTSLHLLKDRHAFFCALTACLVAVTSIAVAPIDHVSPLAWVGLLSIGALSMTAVIAFIASDHHGISIENRQHRQTAALTLAVTAGVLNMMFGFWSTVLLALGMFIIVRQARSVRPGQFPWMLGATIVLLIPWWTWSALDAWSIGLFLLLPLAALAFVSADHLRDAYQNVDPDAPLIGLSNRAHRYASWIAMSAAGVLIVVAGLIGTTSHAWVALGGIVLALAVPLEAGSKGTSADPARISDVAFLIAAMCWLIAIV